jgi:hypothetical protein
VPGLTTRYRRRTCSLQAVLQAVALDLGGRAGRPADRQAVLRGEPVRADPADPRGRRPGVKATPLVLGVDDFALRKGTCTAPS